MVEKFARADLSFVAQIDASVEMLDYFAEFGRNARSPVDTRHLARWHAQIRWFALRIVGTVIQMVGHRLTEKIDLRLGQNGQDPANTCAFDGDILTRDLR